MKLEDIGFYTLSDARAEQACTISPMWRCEILLTSQCNFRCLYCRGLPRHLQGNMPIDFAKHVIDLWVADGLINLRFSGGEPLLYPSLEDLVCYAQDNGVERIALSTNGSFHPELYRCLVEAGVNDFSISLDACCSEDVRKMSGGRATLDLVAQNIAILSKQTYVTVGIVLTPDNINSMVETVIYADSLGVDDIRIIPSAQWNQLLSNALEIPQEVLDRHPILAYRVGNIRSGRNIRGLAENDSAWCPLVLDDSVVAGQWHYPCVIYLREGGQPIGEVGPKMRDSRSQWHAKHSRKSDPICGANCLDVCIDYNNRHGEYVAKRLSRATL